ncbi:MAG: Plug domain-containing protein, partial [Xanthomonadales bacterium]|nr:Plug domain-containing protein [Xanthomonadales bacterium]
MTTTFRMGFFVSSLFILTAQNHLRANDGVLDDLYETDTLEHVQVTATRSNKRDIDISAAVTAINEAEVLKLAPDVVAEMLRGQPGAFFQQTTPGQGIPIIRGL